MPGTGPTDRDLGRWQGAASGLLAGCARPPALVSVSVGLVGVVVLLLILLAATDNISVPGLCYSFSTNELSASASFCAASVL